MPSPIITTSDPAGALESYLLSDSSTSIFLLTDTNIEKECLPLFQSLIDRRNIKVIVTEAGEENKDLSRLSEIWRKLSDMGATRNSLLINLGGGVVTDMGGFAAATFKRGIRYLNIPTTILGAVDAAAGGKTAIDFNGLKNEIGAFHKPENIILSTKLFRTLPEREKLSGFAEMVKMAMISDPDTYRKILREEISPFEPDSLSTPLRQAVKEKIRITDADPTEKGLRKILNFGHTAGHAFESLMLEKGKPITHGEAVAHGILVALIISHSILHLPSQEIYLYANEILKKYYTRLPVFCKDTDRLIELMLHDKKNPSPDEISFTLLSEIGKPHYDILLSPSHLRSALDIYLDLLSQ